MCDLELASQHRVGQCLGMIVTPVVALDVCRPEEREHIRQIILGKKQPTTKFLVGWAKIVGCIQ